MIDPEIERGGRKELPCGLPWDRFLCCYGKTSHVSNHDDLYVLFWRDRLNFYVHFGPRNLRIQDEEHTSVRRGLILRPPAKLILFFTSLPEKYNVSSRPGSRLGADFKELNPVNVA